MVVQPEIDQSASLIVAIISYKFPNIHFNALSTGDFPSPLQLQLLKATWLSTPTALAALNLGPSAPRRRPLAPSGRYLGQGSHAPWICYVLGWLNIMLSSLFGLNFCFQWGWFTHNLGSSTLWWSHRRFVSPQQCDTAIGTDAQLCCGFCGIAFWWMLGGQKISLFCWTNNRKSGNKPLLYHFGDENYHPGSPGSLPWLLKSKDRIVCLKFDRIFSLPMPRGQLWTAGHKRVQIRPISSGRSFLGCYS